MKPSETLAAAKALIADERNWTQEAFARDENGWALSNGYDVGACKFCSLGALEKATGRVYTATHSEKGYLGAAVGKRIVVFNDENSHSAVMDVFDKAIKIAEYDELAKAEEGNV